jgi:O-antigen/teichoic acid export membrane protein
MSGQSFARGFAWTVVTSFVTKTIAPIVGIVAARALGPETMGAYAILQTLLMFTDVFRDAGLAVAYINDQRLTPARERSYQRVAIVTALGLGCVVAAASWPVASFFDAPQLGPGMLWTAAAVAGMMLTAIPAAKLLRENRFREAGLIDATATVVSYLLTLALVIAGHGFLGLILNATVRASIIFALCRKTAPVGWRDGEPGTARAIVGRTASLVGMNAMATAFLFVDQFVLTRLFGLWVGGQFGMAKWLVTRPGEFIAGPLVRVAQVAYGQRAQDAEALARTMYKATAGFLLVVAPVHLAILALADSLIVALLTNRYAFATPLVAALAAHSLVRVYGPIPSLGLVASGRSHVPLVSWSVGWAAAILYVALRWRGMDLMHWVWFFLGVLILVNLITTIWAIAVLPPSARSLASVAKSGLVCCGTGAVALAVRDLGDGSWHTLALAVPMILLAQVAIAGTALAGDPFACRSKARIKRIWEEL